MKFKFYIISLFVCLLQTSLFAQDKYLMVIGTNTNDQTVVDILTTAGYTVFRGLDYTGIVSTEKLDSLNNAGLVIFSRNGGTSGYGTGDGVAQQWADVTAPILSLSPWIMRSSRWMWVNTADSPPCAQSDSIFPTEEGLEHPIFTNVQITESGNASFTIPEITRNELFVLSEALTIGNGIALAYDGTGERYGVMAAVWEAGYPFYEGSLTPASNRMYLAISEGDNCKLETIQPNLSSQFNGTDTGKKILLNAVAFMQGKEIVNKRDIYYSGIKLNAFPNPASNMLNLTGLSGSHSYKVFNSKGAVVLSGITEKSIEISKLESGLYILNIENSQFVKFLKK